MNIGRFEEELVIEPVDQLDGTDAGANEVTEGSPMLVARDGMRSVETDPHCAGQSARQG